MRIPDRQIVERIKDDYPAGTRVELLIMDDAQAPPKGTKGTVTGVDDTGSIMVSWDNGSALNVIYGEDVVRKICPICGAVMPRHPAISRKDNKTKICSECGVREALSDFGMDEEEAEEVIAIFKRLSEK